MTVPVGDVSAGFANALKGPHAACTFMLVLVIGGLLTHNDFLSGESAGNKWLQTSDHLSHVAGLLDFSVESALRLKSIGPEKVERRGLRLLQIVMKTHARQPINRVDR